MSWLSRASKPASPQSNVVHSHRCNAHRAYDAWQTDEHTSMYALWYFCYINGANLLANETSGEWDTITFADGSRLDYGYRADGSLGYAPWCIHRQGRPT